MVDQATELAELRAEQARLVAEREKREVDRSVQEEIEEARLAIADEQAIATAEAEHGPVGKALAVVHTRLGCIVLKRAHSAKFRRFQEVGANTLTEFEKLVRPCVVSPDTAKFDAIIEELPAVITQCANEIVFLAGVKREELKGK